MLRRFAPPTRRVATRAAAVAAPCAGAAVWWRQADERPLPTVLAETGPSQVAAAAVQVLEQAAAATASCVKEVGNLVQPASCEESTWKVISLDEVKKHTTEESLWVTHEGGVYDVTQFIKDHPGGPDLLISAGGCDMAPFWDCYKVHNRSDYARGFLEAYKIGELSAQDAEKARAPETWELQHNTSTSRMKQIYRKRAGKLMLITCGMTVFYALRRFVQLVGVFCPPLARLLARHLPISVPGYSPGSASLPPVDPKTGKKSKIAVIGGGIAGSTCAYSLTEAGYDVTVYEARKKLGGNARVCEWSPGPNGERVATDVTVLFFCPEFYKNYILLMKRLGANFKEFYMPYILHSTMDGVSKFFTMLAPPGYDDPKPDLRDEYKSDLRAWGRAVTVSRLFNWAVIWDTRPTYYANGSYLATFNPMNFISARRLCSWMGMSERFWEEIITPYHCLNMSCLTMDEFPAVGLDALDRTAPLRETRTAVSWSVGNSEQVFKKLTENLTVKTWTRVMKVDWQNDGTVEVHDDQGDVLDYDRVVFACPASACVTMLQDRVGWLERALLRGVRYEDDVSREFMQGICHEDPTVLPEKERSRILRDACFVMDIKPDPATGKPLTETTHNMAPWPPATEVIGKTEKPMIVTHCLHPDKTIDESKVRLRHDYGRSHPSFTMSNLILTRLMPLVQGQRGVYFISNWVCQGNGHDLSCLSGLACANAIGAPYLFPEDELAKLDFQRLTATLGLDENQHTPWGRVAVALGPVMAIAAGLGRCSSFISK